MAQVHCLSFRPRKALADAEEAIRLDKYFHDALVVRARSFAEIGLYSKARSATHEYLKLVPGDAAMEDFCATIRDKVASFRTLQSLARVKADTSMPSPDELGEIEQRPYLGMPDTTAKGAHGYMKHFMRLAVSDEPSSVTSGVKG